jgi:probable addiction module antidote protein
MLKAGKANSSSALKAKKMTKISKFDTADYLKSPVAIAAYLTEAFETNDLAYICTALDTVARAKGIKKGPGKTGAFDLRKAPQDQRE